jgi:hypothetical protein
MFVRGLIVWLIGWYRWGALPIAWHDLPYCPEARDLVYSAPAGVACAVAVGWSMLALTGAGRKPSDWFGRLGFLFGLLWILWYLGSNFMLLLR